MAELLKVEGVSKKFVSVSGLFKRQYTVVSAVDNVSFSVSEGETFGLVGESGSGKTTVARIALGLESASAGRVLVEGVDVSSLNGSGLKELRKRMGVVFQDPASSLNPRATIGQTLRRPLEVHGFSAKEMDMAVEEAMDKVHLNRDLLSRYPHQLSGGQQQRVSVARAIVLKPKCLILDEPTSALDLSVQAHVLNLLLDLQEQDKLTYLFITHDLDVVKYVSDRIGVMYLGQMMEAAPVDDLMERTAHPYSYGLLCSAPIANPRLRGQRKFQLTGEIASQVETYVGKRQMRQGITGCRLRTRCPFACETCAQNRPELREVSERHFVACDRVPLEDLPFSK